MMTACINCLLSLGIVHKQMILYPLLINFRDLGKRSIFQVKIDHEYLIKGIENFTRMFTREVSLTCFTVMIPSIC